MGDFAYLVPVGPFAGLSKAARNEIRTQFPTLSVAEIERAAERFSLELLAPSIQPRLTEARDQLNVFGKELDRFRGAVEGIRRHQLDCAIGEASRMISGQNELENLDRCLSKLRTAFQRTSRAIPVGCAPLASRRLITTLAIHMQLMGLSIGGNGRDSLLGLVNLIFDDLMIGGDAENAVTEWHKSRSANPVHDLVGTVIELVVP